ncbi:hypothetical protein V1477_018252 [Vespula maculifrons]|uniref:Uncharacterized protein n=1 Tax=Vespula maculifrons TaxID=7453 RepID=A0ABD2AYX5_VESMC
MVGVVTMERVVTVTMAETGVETGAGDTLYGVGKSSSSYLIAQFQHLREEQISSRSFLQMAEGGARGKVT